MLLGQNQSEWWMILVLKWNLRQSELWKILVLKWNLRQSELS
jgi:hypothetical protein